MHSAVSAHVWSYQNHSVSKLLVQQSIKVPITSVAVSLCGIFGLLGYANGAIGKFNMQSGKDRGLFTSDDEPTH